MYQMAQANITDISMLPFRIDEDEGLQVHPGPLPWPPTWCLLPYLIPFCNIFSCAVLIPSFKWSCRTLKAYNMHVRSMCHSETDKYVEQSIFDEHELKPHGGNLSSISSSCHGRSEEQLLQQPAQQKTSVLWWYIVRNARFLCTLSINEEVCHQPSPVDLYAGFDLS